LVLANPISSDLGAMRPSILPNLLQALQRNADHGQGDLALFEVAPIYFSDHPEGQMIVASGARRSRPVRHWSGGEADSDVFTVKADAFAALEAAGAKITGLQVMDGASPWYHPGRSGTLRMGPKNILAEFGELHPGILKKMDIDGPIYGFEAKIETIPIAKKKSTKTRPALDIPELLPLARDFAFLVDEEIEAISLIKAAKGAEKKLVAAVSLFDVYRGKGVPDGKKSMALEVTLQPYDKTLTDEEIEAVARRIVAQVEKVTGGVLRG